MRQKIIMIERSKEEERTMIPRKTLGVVMKRVMTRTAYPRIQIDVLLRLKRVARKMKKKNRTRIIPFLNLND